MTKKHLLSSTTLKTTKFNLILSNDVFYLKLHIVTQYKGIIIFDFRAHLVFHLLTIAIHAKVI